MKKALIVATVLKKHIVQFHLPLIKMLRDMGWQVDVAAADDYDGGRDVSFCDRFYDIPFSRSPLGRTNLTAYRRLKQIIDEGHYDVIHCNTPVGGLVARLAAGDARRTGTRVIYQAHGFHFYKGAPLKNRILYYLPEKLCSWFTDVLITINSEDYELAKKRLHAKTTEYVPGVGIDLGRFRPADDKKDIKDKLIVTTGELIKRKNHETVIRALSRIRDDGIRCRIFGDGELRDYLQKLIDETGQHDRIELMGYRNDIDEQLREADLYIQPSYQEGLPASLMEAMASKVPIIASDIRGNRDLLNRSQLFDPDDAEKLAEMITDTLGRDNTENIERNYSKLQDFSLPKVMEKMKEIYSSIGQI